MKALKFLGTGVALFLVLGLMTQGQDRERPRPEGPSLLPPRLLERLDLNAEQKEKIAKLTKAFQEKVERAKKKLDEAVEQAKQNQDRPKFREAQETFQKEVGPIQESFREQVAQILTEEQRRQLGELSRRDQGGSPSDLPRILGQLDLNREQKEKIEKLLHEFKERQGAAQKKFQEAFEQARQNQDRAKVRELVQAKEKETAKLTEELQGKVQGLLTEDQKKRFAEVQQQRRRPEGFGPTLGHILPPPLQERLGLTAEQRNKVANLQKEIEAKLRDILNEEQNKNLEEIRKGVPAERKRKE